MEAKQESFNRYGEKDNLIDVSADDVLNAIAEGQDIDINYAIINGHIDIRDITGRLKNDEVGRQIIKSEIHICNSMIKGNVCFGRTVFNKGISFKSSVFDGYVNFDQSIFSNVNSVKNYYISFQSAIFNKQASFMETIFDEDVHFMCAKFMDYVSFSSATFKKLVSFYSSTLTKGIFFDSTMMYRPANFANLHYKENTVLKGLWNLVLKRFRKPITDFSGFNTTTIMNGASNPYLKRYIDDEQWIESWRQKSRGRQVLFYIWELTSHCGRSFLLWMSCSLILALIFGFLYKGHINIDPRTANNWYTPFYFSVVTFTTLGFGDVKPADWVGQLWITLEVISGYLMLGGLLSIFANKFARRS